MKYHHRQFNYFTLGIFIGGFCVSLVVALIPEPLISQYHFFEELYRSSIEGREYYALVISTVIFVTGINFASMVIDVDREQIRWFYGLGIPFKKIPMEAIKSVIVDRSKWWQGWGIRRIGSGWMYNVSGLDTIIITENSGKVTVLGSNDVQGLLRKINKLRMKNPNKYDAEAGAFHG